MIQSPTQIQPDDDPSAVKPPAQPKIPQSPLTNPAPTAPTVGAASPPPMTPPAATPTPAPMTPPALAGPSQTPLTNPAGNAPTIAPASPGPAQYAGGGGPDTPAGYTYDAVAQGWNVPANQVTGGAANNPVGNAAFQWVVDPISGGYVKQGQENVVGADGMVSDAQGHPVDMPGSTHTYSFNQGDPGTPMQESFQRAGINGLLGPSASGDGHGGGAPSIGPAGGSPLPSGGEVNTAGGGQALGGFTTSSGDTAPAQSPLLAAASGSPSGVNLSTINPDSDLRSQTVLPGQESNRLDIANRELKNYEDTELPQYRNKLRSVFQGNAALGRNGSGMLRTDVGNLDLAEQNALNSKKTSLLDAAMGDQIGDNRANRDEFRTERGRQDALEGQAYDRGVQGLTLEDSLKNSALGRGLAQFNTGQSGNPAQMQLLLSQIFGGQASSAGQALAGMVKGNASNAVTNGAPNATSNTGDPSDIWNWLQSQFGGGNPADASYGGGDDGEYGVAP